MEPEPGPTATPAPAPPTGADAPAGDWPDRAADLVDTFILLVREKTLRPLTLAARAIIFGIIVFAAVATTVLLLSITLVRVLTVYVFNGRVWASDLLLGTIFVVAGIVAWSQRTTAYSGRPETL